MHDFLPQPWHLTTLREYVDVWEVMHAVFLSETCVAVNRTAMMWSVPKRRTCLWPWQAQLWPLPKWAEVVYIHALLHPVPDNPNGIQLCSVGWPQLRRITISDIAAALHYPSASLMRMCAIMMESYSYPRESEGMRFTGVGLSISVCLSVTTITKKVVDGFVPNFMKRFPGGKVRPSSCFVTIGRGMWK